MNFYEVQIQTPKSLKAEFLDWLTQHMEDMVQLPTFTHYQCLEVLNPSLKDVHIFQVRYFYNKPEDLQTYLDKYASAMRGDLPEAWRPQLKFERHLGTLSEL